MSDGFIKRLLPRGLYGRAALILVVPIITIQFVVSVVFIQRHFEGVTRQMTAGVMIELRLILDQIEASPSIADSDGRIAEIAEGLNISLDLSNDVPIKNRRLFYDLSGATIVDVMSASIEGFVAADLASNSRRVHVLVETGNGLIGLGVERRRFSASNPHQLLVLMLVTGALMTVIAYLFLRNQLRPIRRLALAADAFGKGQVVPYRLAGATEVRLAGKAFLDMRSRIERQIEQRTMMLSGVSHDLRTPLTRLKLALSLAEDTEETREMRHDVDEMERMLDTFLDFARGSVVEEPEKVVASDLLERVAGGFNRSGRVVDIHPSLPRTRVSLRAVAVERALQNLIGNALRYGSKARCGMTISKKVVIYTVEDDGPGIPKDQRETAMKAFSRLDEARNQNRGTGVGLGLAIAADVARSHGGLLRLGDSEDMGGLKAELVLAR